MDKLKENSVTRWFGEAFEQLHPLLQQLHRYGGVLSGEVQIRFGANLLSKFLGKRLARKLGIPLKHPNCAFEVQITHTDDSLIWARRFGDNMMTSQFKPIGKYPTGYWQETTEDISLQLGVTIQQGAWHWQQRCTTWKGRTLPACLIPSTTAYKYIDQGQYVFHVNMYHPRLGLLLEYAGRLALEDLPPWLKYPNTETFWGGWRQGNSEFWLLKIWLPFWERLSSSERLAYLEKYPPPTSWKQWKPLQTQIGDS